MQKAKKKILSTRPVGEEMIKKAAMHGILIDEISFIDTVEWIDKKTSEKIIHLSQEDINAVFTSMNGVEAVRRFITPGAKWKIFCIGNTTRKLAEEIFEKKNIEAVGNSADNLADEILKLEDIKKVYFFCGDKRREELPQKLHKIKVEVEELTVYKTIKTSQVISKQYDGILFFSPSAVNSYFSKNSISESMTVFAIGETTAKSIKQFTPRPVIVAEIPDKKNLVAQAIKHFSKNQLS